MPRAALRAALGFPPTGDVARHSIQDCSACGWPSAAFLPPCIGSQCTATGLMRQGSALLRTSSKGTAVWAPARAGWRTRRTVWGQRAPTPLVRRCAPRVGRAVFHWPGCVRPGTGGGRVLLPLTASHGSGDHGGGRPLAAARGCRLLRRFFFLLKTRNVILAGPRPGQASRRSVRPRTLDMACSARIGAAQEGGRKRKNAAATGRFAARGRTACFTPRRHGKNGRSGGSTGTRRCTAAAHSPQKNPLDEDC